MNTSWLKLINESESSNHKLISGEWFAVRFTPDIIAGEVFNIGVVFIDEEKKCHYKLLKNANAFSCLFGDKGKTNINFLLKVVDDVLSKNNYNVIPSPHVHYSGRKTAQGESIDEILDDLYGSMVSLICRTEEKGQETALSSMSTKDLRKHVFGMMKREYPEFYERAIIESPFEITNSETQKSILVDMPIRYYSNLKNNLRDEYYGTIVSAAYVNEVHRIHNINYIGVTNVMNCLEILGREVNTAMIVYLPPVDESKFTEAVRDQAERELDKCLYGLRQMRKDGYQLKLEVEESTDACFHRAIEFISS